MRTGTGLWCRTSWLTLPSSAERTAPRPREPMTTRSWWPASICRSSARGTGGAVSTVLSKQPVLRALLRQIEAGHHDLVVVGSRGRGGVRSALLGSVSHYVLHHSPVPVLIVHAHPSSHQPTQDRREAIDLSLLPAQAQ